MAQKYSSFSYKAGNSLIHKLPSWIKLLLIPALNIIVFCLPPVVSIIFLVAQFILCCFLKFTLKEQFQDLKPVIYYAILLYIFNLISSLFTEFSVASVKDAFLNKETSLMLIKLFCIMQSASILYKTSTSLEIREGIAVIESCIRKIFQLNKKLTFTNAISLFVTFIPMVFAVWQKSKKAWIARGGKNNIKMYITLLPVLFSVGMKNAYNSARAIAIRE